MILLRLIWVLTWTVPGTEENAEAISRSETLLSTIRASWTGLVQKLDDLEYTSGPWTPGTHPFNYFKYKLVIRPLAFATAMKNCERMAGNLIYGDMDLAKHIPDFNEDSKVWYSTKDTRSMTAMKSDDIQNFVDSIGTCYTLTKTTHPVTIVSREENCDKKHASICVKMLESHREVYTYEADIHHMKRLAARIEAEDKALTNTLQRLLQMGHPATDLHHPAGLGQTIQLLTDIDQELSSIYDNTSLFPEKNTLLEGLHGVRTSAHTMVLMILAQHLENYASKIDTLISNPQHIKTEEEQNSGLTDELSDNEANPRFQTALEVRIVQDDIAAIKQRLEQINTEIINSQDIMNTIENLKEQLESVTSVAHNNRRRIKTSRDYINNLSTRLNQWIQEETKVPTTTEQGGNKEEEDPALDAADVGETVLEELEEINTTLLQSSKLRNLTLPFKLPRSILDFLQNEEYIWIATSVTILFTIIAVTNSVVTCIYMQTSNRRNKAIKKHLRWGPKERRDYRKEQDVETTVPLNTSRLEDIESQIQSQRKEYHPRLLTLEEQVNTLKTQMETVLRPTRTGRQRKKNKTNAPAVPPRT